MRQIVEVGTTGNPGGEAASPSNEVRFVVADSAVIISDAEIARLLGWCAICRADCPPAQAQRADAQATCQDAPYSMTPCAQDRCIVSDLPIYKGIGEC